MPQFEVTVEQAFSFKLKRIVHAMDEHDAITMATLIADETAVDKWGEHGPIDEPNIKVRPL